MKSRWFAIGIGISLVTFALSIAVCVQSYVAPWRRDINRDKGEFDLYMESDRGEFNIGETHHFEEWHVAYWKIAVLSLVPAARRLQLWCRQLKQVRDGLCGVCGYDLRATPERCPECGTIPPKTGERSG